MPHIEGIYDQLGDLEATLTAMQKATVLRSDHLAYLYHLGLVYSDLGQPEQAVEVW